MKTAWALTKVGARARFTGVVHSWWTNTHHAVENRALPVDLKKLSFASCTGGRDESTASSRNDSTEI